MRGPGELVEKSADAEAPRPPTPFETESWFTAEFTRLRAENARRVSDGKPARRLDRSSTVTGDLQADPTGRCIIVIGNSTGSPGSR